MFVVVLMFPLVHFAGTRKVLSLKSGSLDVLAWRWLSLCDGSCILLESVSYEAYLYVQTTMVSVFYQCLWVMLQLASIGVS